MTIENGNISGAGQDRVELTRTHGAEKVDHAHARRSEGRSGGSTDAASLSGLSQTLSELSSGSGDRAERVDEIAKLYAAGRYEVDAQAVSRKLVEEALSS